MSAVPLNAMTGIGREEVLVHERREVSDPPRPIVGEHAGMSWLRDAPHGDEGPEAALTSRFDQ